MTNTDGVIELRKTDYKKEHLIMKGAGATRKLVGFYCLESDQVQLTDRVSGSDLKQIATKIKQLVEMKL